MLRWQLLVLASDNSVALLEGTVTFVYKTNRRK
jgi:hypothetical protein